MKSPPRPGDLIKTEIIEALRPQRVEGCGRVEGAARHTLRPSSWQMALRIEKAFGPDMDHLLQMQLAYDVAKTRQHSGNIVIKRYVPVA